MAEKIGMNDSRLNTETRKDSVPLSKSYTTV